ncbi:MAG: acylphosphatase [Flavobacteriales bacterium]|nr:acylphosphatase [Flavobacteriales bacterium]
MRAFHRTIRVQGRVQGVGFRAAAMAEAKRLGLSGTAMNLASGGVEIHVEGGLGPIEEFTRWAGIGPTLAQVVELVIADGPLEGLTDIRVIR